MFGETFPTVGDFNDPTHSSPLIRSWNRKIAEADAYLVITPEYHHSVAAVLKNAIDSVFDSFAFRNKPISVLGYSGGIAGGVPAIEHLASLVYGFTKAVTDGRSAAPKLTLLPVSVALLLTFVTVEARSTHPLLPLRVVLERNRGGSYLATLLNWL